MQECEILVVEDSEADRRLIREAFAQAGRNRAVTFVEDGEAAIARLGTESLPGLILLDLSLPNIEGTRLLSRLKGHPELGRIPVIVFTGSAGAVNECYDAHANCYVRKPAELDVFFAVVKSIEAFWCRIVELPSF